MSGQDKNVPRRQGLDTLELQHSQEHCENCVTMPSVHLKCPFCSGPCRVQHHVLGSHHAMMVPSTEGLMAEDPRQGAACAYLLTYAWIGMHFWAYFTFTCRPPDNCV